MDHTYIIRAKDLERYADTRESQAVIPELIYLLVKQSVYNFSAPHIPYGNSVNQPGWDGIIDAAETFCEFVPKGKSYWEIGTGKNPQAKATEDFNKRTKDLDLSQTDRSEASFIFVTPRSAGSDGWNEPKRTKWLQDRKDLGWGQVQIIDGDKLANWLREFPAIGKWMAKNVGITSGLGGLTTPREHWDIIVDCKSNGDPPLPPKLFTAARSIACDHLEGIFNGKNAKLFLFVESPLDVEDFVAGYLASLGETGSIYANRCLFISEEDAWRSVAEVPQQHVLVASHNLGLESQSKMDLQTVATRKGHAVIIPLCESSKEYRPDIIKLGSPSREEIETILKQAGYSDVRARELAEIGDRRIWKLRRYLLGLGAVPPYATWDNVRELAQAGLLGKWDGKNEADREAIEDLLGKGYGEWIETLRPDVLRSGTPLIQTNEKWRLVARGETWDALGNRITDEDIDRFQEMTVAVLGERDPKFDLPEGERFAAGIFGKKTEVFQTA